MRRLLAVLIGVVLAPLLSPAPANAALAVGNYNAYIEGRYDFHSWIWSISLCDSPGGVAQCANISANPTPIAKAFQWYGQARQTGGTYTLAVDVPDGLRCGNVYYGPVIPTRDVYTWDAATLTGTLQSSFTTGCGGDPGGTANYPFRLVRL